MGRFLPPIPLVLLAAGLFVWWMHPQVLDITNVGWTLNGKDWGQNALGLAAYLRQGAWPGGWTPLILAPEGVHLLMMDSNPLLGLLLKPFAGWLLPPGVQFVGWVLLLNLLLHVGFAWLLVRDRAPSAAAALAGAALLSLLPTLYNRYPHSNLAAHWLILWALWLFAERPRSWGQWLVLTAIAGLIHSYLLLMVLAIWASAVLREVAIRGDRKGAVASLAATAGVGVALALYHGLTDPPVSTGTYGSFPMALDALWNPVLSTNSVFLPASMYSPNQGFEGFQYLGAGLLLLVAVALATSVRRGPRRDGMVWLAPAFLALTLVAVSDVVVIGGARWLHARPPQGAIDALDLVRASGRLFWPVAYAIVYAAVLAIYRLPKAGLVLAAALVVQVADMTPMMAAIRAETARAATSDTYRRTRDPRWDALIARAGAIDVEPHQPFRDVQLIEELGWRAMLACRPLRYMYASRVSRAATARLAVDRRAFLAGRIDPTWLVVLYPGEPVPAPLAKRARVLDGVTVIPPARAGPPPACPSSPRSAS